MSSYKLETAVRPLEFFSIYLFICLLIIGICRVCIILSAFILTGSQKLHAPYGCEDIVLNYFDTTHLVIVFVQLRDCKETQLSANERKLFKHWS